MLIRKIRTLMTLTIIDQTCQTQTSLWAAKIHKKTAQGAAIMSKNPSAGYIQQNLEVANDSILPNNIFSTKNWTFLYKPK